MNFDDLTATPLVRDNYNCTKNGQTFQVGELLLQLSQIDWPEHLSESNR